MYDSQILEFSKWDEDAQEWTIPSPRLIKGDWNQESSASVSSKLPSIGPSAKEDPLSVTKLLTGPKELKLTELKIPMTSLLSMGLPPVSSTNDSRREDASHTSNHSHSSALPALSNNSRPTSNSIQASKQQISLSSSMPLIGAKQQPQETSEPNSSRTKSRKKDRRASKISPVPVCCKVSDHFS